MDLPHPDSESRAERHFIELATRPLEDKPGVRDEARGELMERLSRQDPSQREAMAAAALAHLAKVVPSSWKGKALGIGVAWLLLTGIAVWLAFRAYDEVENDPARLAKRAENERFNTLPKADDLIAITDPATLEEQMFTRSHAIPPDFPALWRKLDPDNGAWLWREAMNGQRKWHGKPESFPELMKLAEEAAAAPRFEFYGPERRAERIARLGSPETCIALVHRMNFPYDWMGSEESLTVKALFKSQADPLVAAKNREELRILIRTWEKLCLRVAAECSCREDFLKLSSMIAGGEGLVNAASSLGMTAEEERIKAQLAGMAAGPGIPLLTRQFAPRAEIGITARSVLFEPAPTPEAFKAGRMAEYALAERFLAIAAAGLLLLPLAFVGIESVRRGRRVNGLASGLSPLFDGRDGLWLIGLGVVAPFALYWVITRLTPLGGRDAAIFNFRYPAILIQALAALLLGLVLVIQTAQWRIGRRVRILGLGSRQPWIGWAIVGIAAALVPAIGIGRWLPDFQIEEFFLIVSSTCGILLLWVLWKGGVLLFGPNVNALPGVLLARAASLPLLLATALLLAAAPLLLAMEKNWVAQDEVTGWDAKRGMTKQEARSVDHVVARCRELFSSPETPKP